MHSAELPSTVIILATAVNDTTFILKLGVSRQAYCSTHEKEMHVPMMTLNYFSFTRSTWC